LEDLLVFAKLSTTSTAGQVRRFAEGRYIHIEVDGIGAAIYDILHEGDNALPLLVPITVGGGTSFRDKSKQLRFKNIRSAMWWNMREILDPIYGLEVMLPPVDSLILDLSTPKFEIKSDGYVQVESKEQIRKRLGRSTDYGDACCLAFWDGGSYGGGVVF
jgi:hypothetical protein